MSDQGITIDSLKERLQKDEERLQEVGKLLAKRKLSAIERSLLTEYQTGLQNLLAEHLDLSQDEVLGLLLGQAVNEGKRRAIFAASLSGIGLSTLGFLGALSVGFSPINATWIIPVGIGAGIGIQALPQKDQ